MVRLATDCELFDILPGLKSEDSRQLSTTAPELVGNYLGPGRFRPGFIDVAMGAKSVAHPGYVPLRLPCQAAILAD